MATQIYSMTGFARLEGGYEDEFWHWEIRSVNGKSLDMRLRLPAGFEGLYSEIRKIVNGSLNRGNLQIHLDMSSKKGAFNYSIDQDWLCSLVDAGQELIEGKMVKPARLDGLYVVPGVILETTKSASDPAFARRNTVLLKSLDGAISQLKAMRAQEGDALLGILSSILDDLAYQTKMALKSKGADARFIKSNFEEKFTNLFDGHIAEDRIAQEAALLTVKADVREEIDRLVAHIEQARALLEKGSPVGRNLDFLSQEFLREVNTLCSKSADIGLTQIGLEMKSLVEQFREQAANVE